MFEAKKALFLYTVSPVHMGAGTALGAIDNPIQRERHTEHPNMIGSGIKGALRHEASTGPDADKEWVKKVFGPETADDGDRHAGALSIADAQLVLFPVRSLKNAFVYATSPLALGRLRRLIGIADGAEVPGLGEEPGENEALVAAKDVVIDGRLVLEAFAFEPKESSSVASLAKWLAEKALPDRPSLAFFRKKIERDLVVLHEDRFRYFVRNATVVEPHVRINDDSGTADEGGLFYTENLPPECLLVSLAMASRERARRNGGPQPAAKILEEVRARFDDKCIQLGGDATTGRGQVLVRFV